ncbi:hypothetical protein A374_01484 [Fictibacillus macauensis ZFHKF-1]|uniref:Uncharacterized protein n=1 Tax=Fictibacillus macauensis ZFHKF-1 TaxID=1196324 RepID=I8UK42_9BACL|nr:hypothetical protein A374_01484 [Fictibacillus macauensis ZFHKF-1]
MHLFGVFLFIVLKYFLYLHVTNQMLTLFSHFIHLSDSDQEPITKEKLVNSIAAPPSNLQIR